MAQEITEGKWFTSTNIKIWHFVMLMTTHAKHILIEQELINLPAFSVAC